MNPLANNIYSLGTVGYLNKNKDRATLGGIKYLGDVTGHKNLFQSIFSDPLSPHNQRNGPRPAINRSQKKILNESIDLYAYTIKGIIIF